MNKKILTVALLVIVLIMGVFLLTGCGEKEENQNNEEKQASVESVPKEDETGTAGSNIALKDNLEEARHQIEESVQKWLEITYGKEVVEIKINVDKMYTYEEEQQEEGLKEKNLGPNEVAFSVKYDLKLADGVEIMKYTATDGEYDAESRWVTNKSTLGILRKTDEGYKITDLGTGW